jgi:hypothetical protein
LLRLKKASGQQGCANGKAGEMSEKAGSDGH